MTNLEPERMICKHSSLIEESISIFGVQYQVDKAIEELIELTTELIRWKKEMAKEKPSNREVAKIVGNIKLERTDVGIMMKDLDLIFGYTSSEALENCEKQFSKLEKYIENKKK